VSTIGNKKSAKILQVNGKIDIQTREFVIEDYDAALDLWQRVEGLDIAEGDSKEEIAQYLLRNAGLSRVAIDGSTLVGVALCSHDGRRGYIYHLAVDPAYQGRGLAKRLVGECLAGLRRAGLKRANILVAKDNPRGIEFWRRTGWEDLDGAAAMGIDV
jgi:ribosomal protein S18 acetylase RimI-like enzyme